MPLHSSRNLEQLGPIQMLDIEVPGKLLLYKP